VGVEHRLLWGNAEEYRSRLKANGLSGNINTSFVERANLTIIDTDDSPGYLFDENGKPRPIVDTVGNLIHSWTTVGNGITNQQGTLTWKGFSGIYEIQWTGPNNSQETASIHVDQKKQNILILQAKSCLITAASTSTNLGVPTNTAKSKGDTGLLLFVGIGSAIGIVLLILGLLIVRRRAG
jgi:hypothetical protein